MKNALILLALGLAACGGGGGSTPPPNPSLSLNPALWTIGPIINGVDSSVGMPINPASDPAGWSFQFPAAPGSVHYVSTSASAAGKSTMTMTYEIDAGPGVAFVPLQAGTTGLVRFYIQRKDDDWTRPDGRWWSSYTKLVPGTTTVSFPLTGWTGVLGQTDPVAFAAAIAASGTVGFTFGGDFAGHGVYVTGGSAKFILKSFKLQ